MILDDLGEHIEASKRLPEAIRCYATAFSKERLNSQYIQTLLPYVATERYDSFMMTFHGTNVNGGECGRTLMSFAAGERDKDVVKLLLDTINPDLKDGNFGLTPLSWAARNGHEAIVKLLLETGKVDADSKDDSHGWTPLSWAAENGHEAVVRLLLETGKVKADYVFGSGKTPLSRAGSKGHEIIVNLLYEYVDNDRLISVAQDDDRIGSPFITFGLFDLFFLILFLLVMFFGLL